MSDELTRQAARYLVVGGSGYVLALVTFGVAIELEVHPYAAIAVVAAGNGIYNFLLNRIWSFPRTGRPIHGEFLRFVVVAIASVAVNYLVFFLLYGVAGIAAVPAQAISIALAAPVGFAGNRYWTFRARSN